MQDDEIDIPMTRRQSRAFDALCEAFVSFDTCATRAARPGLPCEDIYRGIAMFSRQRLRRAARRLIAAGDLEGIGRDTLSFLEAVKDAGGVRAFGKIILAAGMAAAL
ncbi:MAG: hypothetical protein WCK05_12870 [Planctomycetota bacterium]